VPTEINHGDGERQLFDIPIRRIIQDWVTEIETLFDYATPR